MTKHKVFHVWDTTETVIGTVSNQFGSGHFILSANHDEAKRTLSMLIDANDERAELFMLGHYIGFADGDGIYQLFEIKDNDITASDGSTAEIYAEHVCFELGFDPIRDMRPTNTSVGAAVTQCLSVTRWSLGRTVDAGMNSASGYYTDAYSFLLAIADKWGVELDFEITVSGNKVTGRYVNVVTTRGKYSGRRFEYSKDTQTVKGFLSMSGVYTALIGRGRGEEVGETEDGDATYGRRITFADVRWSTANGDPADKPVGREYVEDADATARYGLIGGTKPRIGHVVFDQITDPVELLQATWDYLQTVNKPTASYKLSVMDLEASKGPREAVRMGDRVLVIHRAVRPTIEVEARVVGIKRDLLSPENTTLELGDVRSTLSERMVTTARLAEKVQGINENGTFPSDHLQGAIDALKNQLVASGGYDKSEVIQNKGILMENTNSLSDGFGALYMGPGIFAIASSKDGDDWDWRTFGTGRGFTADYMTSGVMQAALVKILGTDNFYWDAGNIVFIAPNNPNRRIHFGCYDGVNYGMAMSEDGGKTWNKAIDFDGVHFDVSGLVTVDAFTTYQTLVSTRFEQTEDAIALKASSETVNALGKVVSQNSASLEVQAGQIASKASQTALNTLTGRVVTAETSITQNANAISLKASQADVDSLDGRVSTAEQKITPTAIVSTVRSSTGYKSDLGAKASNADLSALTGRVVTAETSITQNANAISLKASQADVDSLDGRVSTAEQKITPTAIVSTVRSSTGYKSDLGAKASNADLSALTGRVVTAETSITQNANAIALKAAQSTVDSLGREVSKAAAELVIQAGQIAAKVGLEDYVASTTEPLANVKVGTVWFDGTSMRRCFSLDTPSDGSTRYTWAPVASKYLMTGSGVSIDDYAAIITTQAFYLNLLSSDGSGNAITSITPNGIQFAGVDGNILFDLDAIAKTLELTGIIYALGGKIGPLTISDDGLHYGDVFSLTTDGLVLKNAQGATVFNQDSTSGNLDITGILRAIGGVIGGLTIGTNKLSYGTQLVIDTSGSPYIKIGNLLLRYVNSGSEYGLIYGDAEMPNFAASDVETYIGKVMRITPSAMPSQLQGTLMTYDRGTGQVGSGYKIAHGSVNINDTTASTIYYSDAGFEAPPNIVATYSKQGANSSGARGAIKVYNKTPYSATLIIAGNYPDLMDVDWIAIGR